MKPAVLRGHNACLPQAFYWPNVHAGMVFCDWSCSASVNLRPAKLEENYRNGWSQETYRFSGGVKAAGSPGHCQEMFRANHYIRTIFRLNIYIASTHVEAESNEWIPVRRLRPVALLSCLSSKVPYVYTYTCTVLLYHIFMYLKVRRYCTRTVLRHHPLDRNLKGRSFYLFSLSHFREFCSLRGSNLWPFLLRSEYFSHWLSHTKHY